MARRRPQAPPDGVDLLLPLELTVYRADGWPSYRAHWQARHAWFANHGVDPFDWNVVRAIQLASETAHHVPEADTMSHGRRRLVVRGQPAQ